MTPSLSACRGVKKLKRALWPTDSEVSFSTAAQISVETEVRLRDAGQKVRQTRGTAQKISPDVLRPEGRGASDDERVKPREDTTEANHQDARSFRSRHPCLAV